MAYSNNPGPMASGNPSSDMYGDAEPMEGAPKEESQEHGEEGETALLPKSILAGKEFNPGDEVVLKIVRFHGDEVEVAYASEPEKGEEGDEGPPPPRPPPPPEGGGDMAGMME